MNLFQKIMKPKLVIASSNIGKINEFKELLSDFPLIVLGQPKDLVVTETGSTFAENSRLKAIEAALATGEIALSDDSGLSVFALDGAPGIYSSRYGNSDSERIGRLLKELKSFDNRSAFFSASLCLASPKGEILFEVEGRCNGVILREPIGEFGFGYDPVFQVDGTGLTFSQMSPNQKKVFSHRGRAFSALIPGLKEIFKF